jgi:F-type H+-transporting ATPase subunit gamma
MSESVAGLQRKIARATDLQSVVRTMKALASASIAQYERSTQALAQYARTVELGLSVALRDRGDGGPGVMGPKPVHGRMGVVVFGSDQGLVGRFNDMAAEHAMQALQQAEGPHTVWAVGERVSARLHDEGIAVAGLFAVPGSVKAITPLVGQILQASEAALNSGKTASLQLVFCRPLDAATFEPVTRRILPLDAQWQRDLTQRPWPSVTVPEVIGSRDDAVRALVREHLFVSVFRAAAESLASENASRLAAMQRADRNIDDLLEAFTATYHRVRQESIDAELFDVVAGFEAARRADRAR